MSRGDHRALGPTASAARHGDASRGPTATRRGSFAMSGVVREARHEDVPAICRLIEAEVGVWQPHWSDATLVKGIDSAGNLAVVWEDDAGMVGFGCAHDLARGSGKCLVEHIQAEVARRGCRVLIADVWRTRSRFIAPWNGSRQMLSFSGVSSAAKASNPAPEWTSPHD
jgi:hypothetical protein